MQIKNFKRAGRKEENLTEAGAQQLKKVISFMAAL